MTTTCCEHPAIVHHWLGKYCRCCGQELRPEAGCDRQYFGLAECQYCGQNTCGAHSCDGSEDNPVRRFCEICGQRCELDGTCPEHGMQQASDT